MMSRQSTTEIAMNAPGCFTNRVAMVTGAASGIGRAVSCLLRDRGATVIGIDKSSAMPDAINHAVCDLADHDTLNDTIDGVISKYGAVDILVNNAGFGIYERIGTSTIEQWRAIMAVNLDAMFVLAKRVTPSMVKRGYGRIVNVGSIQGLAAQGDVGAYTASKGGVHAWTRCLAVDLSEHGILVNAVAPGAIDTPMSLVNGEDVKRSPTFEAWYVHQRKIPLGRIGDASEVAEAIAFLCGDQCTYITGHTLVVDGGLTITF